MNPITETCTPRKDFLHGELTDQHFAAQLSKGVRNPGACPVCGDPDAFFELTYPSAELKERLRRAFGRLRSGFDAVVGPTGTVTGDSTAALNSTEHLIAFCSSEAGDVESALEELRRAAQETRSKPHRRDFDNSMLRTHDPYEGPWRSDRGDTPQRLAYALDDLLADSEPNLVGSCKVDKDQEQTRATAVLAHGEQVQP